MDNTHFQSILSALHGAPWITADIRFQAVEAVKQHFESLLAKYGIDNVEAEEVQELAEDLVDELCLQAYDKEYDV